MRTTLNIDDDLLARATKLTGIKEKTTLVRKGLEALIALESARRLAALGGSEKKAEARAEAAPRCCVILVDTSVWVDHLRKGRQELATALVEGRVLCHPFVIGELACGGIRNRVEVLALLAALPQTAVAEHIEVLQFVHTHKLHGKGLGWIDVHLLASAQLMGCSLWTNDRALLAAARDLQMR